MKIGVVTYWYGNSNYGMIMQCWALQQYLKGMGHEPFVIRYQQKDVLWKRVAKEIMALVWGIVSSEGRKTHKKMKQMQILNLEKDQKREFQVFRNEHLNMSDIYYQSLKELRKNPPEADYYIAGSDQIWSNQLGSKGESAYYLHFGSKKTKRIAYAPSFGTMKYEGANLPLLTSALKSFDAISCRENEGVEECKKAGYNAIKVEDPTLLLNADDYRTLLKPIKHSNYIFIYSVNLSSSSDIYWEELKKIFPSKEFIVTPASGSLIGGELFGNEVKYEYATVGEWLTYINNSSLVITSSFHGVVFSIVFNKKFAFVPLKGRYSKTNNRIFDLLEALGLNDLIVNTPDDYERITEKNVDWLEVENKKKTLLSNSFEFLNHALT